MKTNFAMLREIADWYPEERGMLSGDEVNFLKEALAIEKMDEVALRNLRDFTVIFYTRSEDSRDWDKSSGICSGICAVIDQALWSMGEEV